MRGERERRRECSAGVSSIIANSWSGLRRLATETKCSEEPTAQRAPSPIGQRIGVNEFRIQ
jgi:hypothetical protein